MNTRRGFCMLALLGVVGVVACGGTIAPAAPVDAAANDGARGGDAAGGGDDAGLADDGRDAEPPVIRIPHAADAGPCPASYVQAGQFCRLRCVTSADCGARSACKSFGPVMLCVDPP